MPFHPELYDAQTVIWEPSGPLLHWRLQLVMRLVSLLQSFSRTAHVEIQDIPDVQVVTTINKWWQGNQEPWNSNWFLIITTTVDFRILGFTLRFLTAFECYSRAYLVCMVSSSTAIFLFWLSTVILYPWCTVTFRNCAPSYNSILKYAVHWSQV